MAREVAEAVDDVRPAGRTVSVLPSEERGATVLVETVVTVLVLDLRLETLAASESRRRTDPPFTAVCRVLATGRIADESSDD